MFLIRNTTIEKHTLFEGVTMDVHHQSYHTRQLLQTLDQHLGVINGGMNRLVRIGPSSIQITSCQRASIVAVNHSVRIEHRNDFEHKLWTQTRKEKK